MDDRGQTSLRAVVEYANMNPQTGNPAANNYLVSLPGKAITLDPEFGTLVIGSNMSFLGLQAEGGGPGSTVQRSGTEVRFGLFQVTDEMNVSFINMTLQGGETSLGGAIKVEPDAIVRVDSCDLINNTAASETVGDYGGANYAATDSILWINNCMLGLNSAEDGGGAICAWNAASLIILDSEIIGNETTGDGAFGGGLYINDTNTQIDDTDIIGNEATGSGGGLYFQTIYDGRTLNMDGGQFYGNTAGGHGGGLYLNPDVNTSVTFTLNNVSVTDNGAGGKGGGVYISRGTLAGSLTALTGNTATGGIPGIAYKANQATVTISVPPNQQTVQQDP